MLWLAARRVLFTIPVLLAVLTISFWATLSVPGDPLASLLPDNPTPEQYQAVAAEFGLDGSLVEQWGRYMVRTISGDLGRSLRTRRPIVRDLGQALGASTELALVAFAIAAMVGVSIGVISAIFANRPIDHILSTAVITGSSAPAFWVALMSQILFFGWLNWLPAGGRIDTVLAVVDPIPTVTGLLTVDAILAGRWDAFSDVSLHLLLPAVVLSLRSMGLIARVARVAMIEALSSDFVLTARAFGARPSRIVLGHALRNAFMPVVTVLGLAFGVLLSGSILVESVFNWPGLGLYTVQSIIGLDYAAVVGASLLITLIYIGANLAADLIYPVIDPRVNQAFRSTRVM